MDRKRLYSILTVLVLTLPCHGDLGIHLPRPSLTNARLSREGGVLSRSRVLGPAMPDHLGTAPPFEAMVRSAFGFNQRAISPTITAMGTPRAGLYLAGNTKTLSACLLIHQ